ncbi:MAG: hypothetical protein ABIG71_04580 [Candidatus Uhrbacteria bacterium]
MMQKGEQAAALFTIPQKLFTMERTSGLANPIMVTVQDPYQVPWIDPPHTFRLNDLEAPLTVFIENPFHPEHGPVETQEAWDECAALIGVPTEFLIALAKTVTPSVGRVAYDPRRLAKNATLADVMKQFAA